MVTQADLYEILQDDTSQEGVPDAAYLVARGELSRGTIRGTLQIQYRTAEGLDQFCRSLVDVTGCEDIKWNRSTPELISEDGENVRLRDFPVDDLDQNVDEALLNAYDDLHRGRKADELADGLSSGSLSQPARIITAIVRRRNERTASRKINESFVWNSLGLLNSEDFERNARRDIMNELVRIGCVAKDGGDIYVRPALASLPAPDHNLPTITVSEKELAAD